MRPMRRSLRVGPAASWPLASVIGLAAVVVAACAGSLPDRSVTSASPIPSATLPMVAATSIAVSRPTALGTVGSSVWAIAGSELVTVDVGTNAVRTYDVGASDSVDGLDATATAIWLADFDGNAVIRVDPAAGRVTDRISTAAPEDVLDVNGTLWVTDHHDGSVTRINDRTDKVIDTVTVGKIGSNGPQHLAFGLGSVWVDESNTNEVLRLDPSTAKVVARIPLPGTDSACGPILPTAAAVWVTGCGNMSSVARIDPLRNQVVATVELTGYAEDLVVVNGAVWAPEAVYLLPSNGLERIDSATNSVDRRVVLGGLTDIGGSTIAGGALWVANRTDTILRLPLTELTVP